jgi:hypothetical protein
MGEIRNEYKVLAGKSQWKRSFGKLRRKLEKIFKLF